MAKISGYQTLVKENFPSKYYDLVGVIAYPLNNVIQQLVNALNNKQLTVGDNLNQQYKTIVVTVDSTGKPLQTLTYKSTLIGKTQGISVVSASNITNSSTYPTSAPFIAWSDNSGTVTISHISGLQANNQYSLTLYTTA